MYIISGRGRKSGVARATGATASLAPMGLGKWTHIFLLFTLLIYCNIINIPTKKCSIKASELKQILTF